MHHIFKNKDKVDGVNAEEKLHIMLGEFIYFSGNHLISDRLNKHIKKYVKKLEVDYIQIYPLFFTVKVAPKGYSTSSAKYLRNSENGEDNSVVKAVVIKTMQTIMQAK